MTGPAGLALTVVLLRDGGPGGEWHAVLNRGDEAQDVHVHGTMPGAVLEELGEHLDEAELAAIAASRADL